MDDSLALILLRLCQELSSAHEIPQNHEYFCPAERMKHEVYKFHLAIESDLDAESLQSLCEDFRNCYLVFVLGIKQILRPMDSLVQASGEEYLNKLLKEATRFIEDIAAEMENNTKLVNVGRLCEIIDKSQEISISLKEYIEKEIEKELEQMQSAVDDLLCEEIEGDVLEFCKQQVEYWQEVISRVKRGDIDGRHGELLINSSKEASKHIDFMVCFVSFI